MEGPYYHNSPSTVKTQRGTGSGGRKKAGSGATGRGGADSSVSGGDMGEEGIQLCLLGAATRNFGHNYVTLGLTFG